MSSFHNSEAGDADMFRNADKNIVTTTSEARISNAPGEYCSEKPFLPSCNGQSAHTKSSSYMDPTNLPILAPPIPALEKLDKGDEQKDYDVNSPHSPSRQRSPSHSDPEERPDPSAWDEDHVCGWVRSLCGGSFAKYATMFREGAVHGPLLLKLDDELLEDLGITRKIHRARILLEIQDVQSRSDDLNSEDGSLESQCDNTQCDTMDVAHITQFFGSRIRNFKYLSAMFEMRPWWMQFCDDFQMKPPNQTFYPVRIRGVRLRNHAHASSSINDTYRCFGLYRNRPAYISDHRASKERRLMLWFNDRRWQVSFFTPQAIVENRRAADVQDQAECAHEISATAVWRVYHKSEKVFHEDRNVQISILPQALVDVIYHSAAAPFTRGTCVEIVSFLDL